MDNNEYIAKYEYLTGLKTPNNFDIHHIDMNRQNNDITNLVCLPLQLHRDFHKLHDILKDLHSNNKTMFTVAKSGSLTEAYKTYRKTNRDIDAVLQELSLWVQYRNYLLGTAKNYNKKYQYNAGN